MTTPDGAEPLTDAELLEAARAGDRDAYGELFERHRDKLHRFALVLARDEATASDLVSETFERVLAQLVRGKGPQTHYFAYLRAAIKNLDVDRRRAMGKEHLVEVPHDVINVSDAGANPIEAWAEATTITRAFSALPARWREVLWRTEVLGESLDEVGRLLGTNANAVAALTHRAREGLRGAYLAEHVATAPETGCESLTRLLPKYVRSSLGPRRAAALEAHISGCDYCKVAVDEMRQINNQLGALLLPALAGTGVLAVPSTLKGAAGITAKAAVWGAGASMAAAGLVLGALSWPDSAHNEGPLPPVASDSVHGAIVDPLPSQRPVAPKPPRTATPEPSREMRASGSLPESSAPTRPPPTGDVRAKVDVRVKVSIEDPVIVVGQSAETAVARLSTVVSADAVDVVLVVDAANVAGYEVLSGSGWSCVNGEVSDRSRHITCTRTDSTERSFALAMTLVDVEKPVAGTVELWQTGQRETFSSRA